MLTDQRLGTILLTYSERNGRAPLAVQYLSSLQPEDLRTTEGKQKAKNELGEGMKAAYKGESVVRVLITALVMQ